MMESRADSLWKRLEKKARRGFRGYPTATVALYGPDDRRASKVVVGIVLEEEGGAETLRKWFNDTIDVRKDERIMEEIDVFLREQAAMSVAMTPGIFGCPHEEGIDYPEGQACPECPFWEGRDRHEIFFRSHQN